MSRSVVTGRRCERGFTLMELLVALTLLGLLMATLFGGLRLGTRVWQSSSDRHEVHGQLAAVRGFLRQRLEEATPVAVAGGQGGPAPVFSGGGGRLTLASSMPASVGPGVFLIDLEFRRNAGDLLLRWRPLSGDPADPAAAGGERILIDDLAAMTVAFFGAANDDGLRTWQNRWPAADVMPELIRVELRFADGDLRRWPPLVVSPMIDEWYDPT